MRILVFNAGSSSLKFGIFDPTLSDSRLFKGEFSAFRDGSCQLDYQSGGEGGEEYTSREALAAMPEAIEHVPALLRRHGYDKFDAIGHRVVHGGARFTASTQIDDTVLDDIRACVPLAPLHNPPALAAIERARALWPGLPQVAVFDTAFHHTIPDYASTYAVPREWRAHGLRRYGFHGTSHHYVALRAAEALARPLAELKLVSCHLGNGASVCAIGHGMSLDTSMGMTPLEGLVMGTRAGDVDPGVFTFLARECGLDTAAVEERLLYDSGLKALAGTQDLRDIEARAATGDLDAQLALRLYAYRARKYIGAYAATLGGIDALIFTGGIGEHSADMRRRICAGFDFLGLRLDEDRNRAVTLRGTEAPGIHAIDSLVQVLVTRTQEQYMIAREVQHLLRDNAGAKAASGPEAARAAMVPGAEAAAVRIPVAVSARHVHLSRAAVDALFGKGHELTLECRLGQAEGWAARETVQLIGPAGSFARVRVLGPVRAKTQIEVSRTDTFTLGLDVPLRDSGHLDGTPTITLRGPAGDFVTDGLIVAARHIHMSPGDGRTLGLHDGDYVDMKVASERPVAFARTLVRIKEGFTTEMHIDTDEANAAGIRYRSDGELIVNHDRPAADVTARTPKGLTV
ncbi:MAG: acetate/propionate family kinase [Gammaproteobacteria bacterium]